MDKNLKGDLVDFIISPFVGIRDIVKDTFQMNDNQIRLFTLATLTFIFQATIFYIMNPKKFNKKWGTMCFGLAFLYNIAYYKFFLDDA